VIKKVVSLVKKELLLEIKQQSGFSGVLIYALSSIYICYLVFRQSVEPQVWNALLWVIILFAATNAIARSFLSESKGKQLFFYSLLDPRTVIISKSIYNFIILSIITSIILIVFITLLGNPVADFNSFLAGLILGVSAISTILTLVSALASKAENNSALMAILGFPLIIPVLLTVIKYSRNAIDGLDSAVNQPYMIILIALNLLIFALSFLLFPYLWRD